MSNRSRRAPKRRSRTPFVIGGGVIVVVAVALGVALIAGGSSSPKVSATEAATVVRSATSVPSDVLDKVGVGTAQPPKPVTGQALTRDGKPEVLYVGAEYCPYCAAERWAMVVALSRFGTFANLGVTHSSSIDVFPNTPTFTFHGATYTSSYLAFTAVETATNKPNGSGGYEPLEAPTAAQQAVLSALDPSGGIPFVDFAGRYLVSGATYDPGLLQHHSAAEVAAALSDPTSPIAKGVGGAANTITAALCRITNGQPAAACTAPGVTAASQQLGS